MIATLSCGDRAVEAAVDAAIQEARPQIPAEPPPIPEELRVVEDRVRNGDVELYVRAIGPAKARATVVVVHGGPGHSHDYLRPLELAASGDLRVVFYDQRGIGRSTAPMSRDPKLWDLAAYRSDLEAVVVHLGADAVHLIGFSWGGILAMDFAIHHTDRVASVALVAAGWPRAATQDDWESFRNRSAELEKAGILPPAPAEFDDCTESARHVLPIYFADPKHPAASRETGSVCSREVTRVTWRAVGKYDLRPALAKLQLPTLIFHGEKDYAVQAAVARDTHASFGGAPKLVIQENCGHRILDECRGALFRELASLWNAPDLEAKADGAIPEPDPALLEQNRKRAVERDTQMGEH